MALRKAIGFWLSGNEKKAHLSLLWDVFEDMNWTKDADRVTMMGRGLDFRRAEAQIRDSALIHCKKMVPFIVMIRAPVDYETLVPWTKQVLSNVMCSTRMDVVEGDKREDRWDSKSIATIEGFAAGIEISIPITVLTQETPQDQLGTTTIDWTVAMSIFKPTLKNVKRIAITKVEWNKVQYETAAVISYKTVDTLRFIISGPPFMTNVSLILRSPSVCMRVVNGYDRSLSYDEEWAALKLRNGREGW
ncbi:hypothetical protein OEA41_008710 [Lepraria neglecta]|uniref:Uncharacterized protein n=1 Tax=Lepraria neglecta TaxID=209136 RepID=A0AAD9Z3K7_9LECA|nr:hypothetical protein OEA41_008710 [Lepraria neglecta]